MSRTTSTRSLRTRLRSSGSVTHGPRLSEQLQARGLRLHHSELMTGLWSETTHYLAAGPTPYPSTASQTVTGSLFPELVPAYG